MNKTVNANISGVVFHIESDAYEKLNQYLNTIRTYFHDSDGREEIMADIEARIAELFKDGLVNGKEVVTMANVQKVIEVMGEPEQYMDEEEAESYSSSHSQSKGRSEAFRTKKLFRDPDDNMLGGVCSGLGYYFGVDRLWFRAAFLVALFGFGTGFLLYLILWIIIPSPKTTADKLEMKGDPINVENIGNTIKDEFGNFKKKVKDGEAAGVIDKAGNTLYKIADFLVKLIVFFFKFIAKTIAVLFILISVTSIVTLIGILIGGPFAVDINNLNIDNAWTADFAEIFFASSSLFNIGLIGIFLVAFIPLGGLLYAGLKILFNIPNLSKGISIGALSLFVIGVIMISISATSTAAQYSSEQRVNENIVLSNIDSDTVRLMSMEASYAVNNFGSLELYLENDEIFMNHISVDVIRSASDSVELKVKKTSNGSSRKDAGAKAENILFDYSVVNNVIKIEPYISVPYADKFRDQEVKVSIALPEGKSIYLDPSSREIIYDIENVTNTYDGKMMGHHWLMTDKGLECTDCDWITKEKEEKESSRLKIEITTDVEEDETI